MIVPIFKCARGILAEKRLQKKFKILHKKTHYVVSNKPATMYNAVPTTDSKNVDEEENLWIPYEPNKALNIHIHR